MTSKQHNFLNLISIIFVIGILLSGVFIIVIKTIQTYF